MYSVHFARPRTVRRVSHEGGSHIEPPLEDDWSDLDKLVWCAGVVKFDGGIEILVTKWSDERFSLSGKTPVRSWSMGAESFNAAWSRLVAMGMGAEIVNEWGADD